MASRSTRLCHINCGGDGDGSGNAGDGSGHDIVSGSDSSGTARTDYVDICRLQTLAMNELLNSTS
ncbi:unnamed protein product [Dibothriocephalus latus]|uniref:Uncharacterized protein n=1 Tax=Dibothriocephalus latus TaxID=60516 RepID=A0A3P6PJM9_DIBLA|nr:unnamed protein product [Dibothriocephalus latus]